MTDAVFTSRSNLHVELGRAVAQETIAVNGPMDAKLAQHP